ncbi:MAG TPA: class A beta-lactamase [Bryobacteraceae bacterium]|nr:class A beta-lactamase [Bryobacteraceae bacterium]
MRLFLFLASLGLAAAAELDVVALQRDLDNISAEPGARIGACVHHRATSVCIRESERFSLQSVMKLLVGVAVLDAVDNHGWRLAQSVTIHKKDLSLFVQPLAKLVGPEGYTTNIGDLVRRAIIDSDSAATDILIARLGGPAKVQAALVAKGIQGIRIDRDERRLQTQIYGIEWRDEFVDAAVLERTMSAVPPSARQRSYDLYQVDPRDTATPKGMANFLLRLAQGQLLAKSSTEFVLQAMRECKTFPDRLKAGVPGAWQIAHKTGTSGSWNGLTAATNDVGILTAPDGGTLSIAVFVADSRLPAPQRAALIARISAAAVKHYR